MYLTFSLLALVILAVYTKNASPFVFVMGVISNAFFCRMYFSKIEIDFAILWKYLILNHLLLINL